MAKHIKIISFFLLVEAVTCQRFPSPFSALALLERQQANVPGYYPFGIKTLFQIPEKLHLDEEGKSEFDENSSSHTGGLLPQTIVKDSSKGERELDAHKKPSQQEIALSPRAPFAGPQSSENVNGESSLFPVSENDNSHGKTRIHIKDQSHVEYLDGLNQQPGDSARVLPRHQHADINNYKLYLPQQQSILPTVEEHKSEVLPFSGHLPEGKKELYVSGKDPHHSLHYDSSFDSKENGNSPNINSAAVSHSKEYQSFLNHQSSDQHHSPHSSDQQLYTTFNPDENNYYSHPVTSDQRTYPDLAPGSHHSYLHPNLNNHQFYSLSEPRAQRFHSGSSFGNQHPSSLSDSTDQRVHPHSDPNILNRYSNQYGQPDSKEHISHVIPIQKEPYYSNPVNRGHRHSDFTDLHPYQQTDLSAYPQPKTNPLYNHDSLTNKFPKESSYDNPLPNYRNFQELPKSRYEVSNIHSTDQIDKGSHNSNILSKTAERDNSVHKHTSNFPNIPLTPFQSRLSDKRPEQNYDYSTLSESSSLKSNKPNINIPQDEYNENKSNYPYEHQIDISPPTAPEITGSYYSSEPVVNNLKKENAYHTGSLHSEQVPSLKQSLPTSLEYNRAEKVHHNENFNSKEQFSSKYDPNHNPSLTSVYPSHRPLFERDQNQQLWSLKLKNDRSNNEHNTVANHDNSPSLAINKEITEPIKTENGDDSYQDNEENNKNHPHLSASSGPQYILQPQPAALIASPAFAQDPVSPLKSSYIPYSKIPKKTTSVPEVVTVPISPVNNKIFLSTSNNRSSADNGQKSFQTLHPVSDVVNKETHLDWAVKMDTYRYDMETWPECAKTSSTYCLEDSEYPSEVIRYAIDKERHVLNRLLAEIKHQSATLLLMDQPKNMKNIHTSIVTMHHQMELII
ncbi:uncharacterized protein LOC143255798 [Tachypleus tridentatus]|uniref:uncharacterized protein LOC143255798 n=1 Tax=Tachypleus tridentatus TaxID=6853 RepID=UPI003FD65613